MKNGKFIQGESDPIRVLGDPRMGRFHFDLEVANYEDLALAQHKKLKPEKIRRLILRGVVDTGATKMVLPEGVVQQLGLRETAKIKVHYADGRSGYRKVVQGVFVALLNRTGVFSAIVEPKRDTALIGAIVLEELDLLVDCIHQVLIPRDPNYVVSEIG